MVVFLVLPTFSPFSCASSLASILASVDMREPHLQWHLALLVVVWARSLCEPFIGKPLAGNAVDKTIESRQGVVFDVALIQPEGKFIDVASKMFVACMVINAVNAALHNRENAFNAVRGHAIADIFASTVIDGFMSKTVDIAIGACFIGVDNRTGLYMLMNCGLDCVSIGASNRHGDGAATTLPHAENRAFPDRPTPSPQLLVFVFIRFFATNKGFVDFDDALKLSEVFAAASFSQSVQDEPSRLLRDADFFGQLHAGNALTGRHKQVHRVNPLVQWNMAALENRASAHRKVLFALIAAVVAALALRDAFAQATNRATWAVGPKPPFEVNPRRFLVREHLEKLEC